MKKVPLSLSRPLVIKNKQQLSPSKRIILNSGHTDVSVNLLMNGPKILRVNDSLLGFRTQSPYKHSLGMCDVHNPFKFLELRILSLPVTRCVVAF